MSLTTIDHFMGCSVAALNGVSGQSPKACLLQYLETLKESTFHTESKSYKPKYKYHWHIHVVFSGPDMRTLPEKLGHYSKEGSCNALAAYIREQGLGDVTESPARWNHRHPERKPGQGDITVYVWSPDKAALEKWHLENKKEAKS